MRLLRKYFYGLLATLSLAACGQAASAQQRSEYWHQRASLFEELPVNKEDIIFVGNSITDGGEFAELFSNPLVKNRGISSDVIDGVYDRIGKILEGKPSKIFLLIGINDISHGHSVKELSSRYKRLVKKILTDSPDTELYLQSVMPINNDFNRYRGIKGKEAVVDSLNLEIKRIASVNNVRYIDLYKELSLPGSGKLNPEYTNDGLHLMGKGYLVWRDMVLPYVNVESK